MHISRLSVSWQFGLLLFLLIVLPVSPALAGESWTGQVIRVIDGDTIIVLKGEEHVRVRLYAIDCPERGEPFSEEATVFTSRMVLKKQVRIEEVDVDRYKRVVAWVTLPDGSNLNLDLLKAGLACWYRKYAPNCLPCQQAERTAAESGLGLWVGGSSTSK